MKIYQKIIHPYSEKDGKKEIIGDYKGRWFSEESKQKIMDEIYNKHSNHDESKIKFFRRFSLRWEERYIEVSFTSNMDDMIEDL